MIPRIELRPGYSIPRLIQGGWQLSAGHRERPLDRAAVLRRLRRAVDAGLDAFDGADIYTGVESLYGELLRSLGEVRSQVRIHTKFVPDLDVLPTIDRAYVRSIVERSLSRLGVERLDLVQFHWWDWRHERWLETLHHLDDLRREGKIHLLGLTNFDTEHLARALDDGLEIAAHQLQYSLLDRRPERGMVELCRGRNVHLLCYGTLAGGFLAASRMGRPEPPEDPGNRSLVKYRLIIDELGGWKVFQELLAVLDRIARRRGTTVSDVAGRWVLDRPGVAAVVVGISGTDRLRDSLRMLDLSLDDEDRSELDAFLRRHPGVGGDVYSVERIVGGRHASIMKTGLNRR